MLVAASLDEYMPCWDAAVSLIMTVIKENILFTASCNRNMLSQDAAENFNHADQFISDSSCIERTGLE